MIDGILPIDKPIGWTSHDVVARVRRLAGQRQVGHAGTLDPLASGLLLLVLGSATKLSSYLMDTTKTYCVEVVLGATTRTDDAEGRLESRSDVAELALPAIRQVLQDFTGEIAQTPPMYAAIRQRGQKLYVLARRGEVIEPEPRRVRIDRIELLAWSPPRLRLRVVCGSGTYIRALARDIGAALRVGGYLHALRRVASGSFEVDEAATLDGLDRASIENHLRPADMAILGLPAVVVAAEEARRLAQGNAIAVPIAFAAEQGRTRREPAPTRDETLPVRVYGPDGALVALGGLANGTVRPRRVFVRV